MARYEAIQKIMESIDEELVICNIGFPSRELYEIDDRPKNFYMIGSMGLASSIGFGLAMAKPHKDVVVIDGDGSLLMNMGSLVTIFANNPSNLTWIVIDNGAYGSTGNQDTYCQKIDLVEAAKGVGYKNSFNFEDINLKDIIRSDDVSFIVYKTEPGNSKAPIIDLDPITIKERFMSSI
ncbi:MAG: sulfopyruvate decarboxylase subunit beta [Methanobrevibacter thaueri]|uniref:sulfopyruvate decarboxylase n=1 Tax=Methanobrevibacter thaueri TaxID=190975 RepID=A0A8T3V3X5_9EURY|nr:sulfopyruvate decarboxylase subunit beta [Methanobrevibacter thaueri]MBE6501233.1 sulfopyruvate decarboxylase subunit beta [Methanobrevibacter thaueri]